MKNIADANITGSELIALRLLSAAEVPQIADCLRKLGEYHNGINPLPEVVYPVYAVPDELRRFGSALSNGSGRILAVFREDSMVGFCAITFDGQNGNIDYLYLDDNCRGYGLGRRLMQWALDEFRTRKLRYAQLKAVIGNQDAIEFYEHCGFKPRACCMVKPL